MRDIVTTALDVAGLGLAAASAGVGLGHVADWLGLAAAGFVLLAGSQAAVRAGQGDR